MSCGRWLRAAALPLAAGALLLGACGKDRGAPDAGAGVDVDTTNTNALDGVSNEQLGEQAVPLTPEQAAARGIAIDTTIHLENLGPRDSFPAGSNTGRTPSPDTTGRPNGSTVDTTGT
ncbi:MAG TPA: hypothetical protein VFQ39_16615 [Longimicrobium sp.]|nr:hypothetical protein [Longimicrobium sp.]